MITFKGTEKSIHEWSQIARVNYPTFWKRLKKYGWTLEECLKNPTRKAKKFSNGKESLDLSEWSKKSGVKKATIYKRMASYGLSLPQALDPRLRTVTHGDSKSRGVRLQLYRKWTSMKGRCRDEVRYIIGNIEVCERWMDFESFKADMFESFVATGHKKGKVFLDRIDNTKGYSPENCRWVDAKKSAENRRSTRWITHAGETLTLSDWSRKKQINLQTLWCRLRDGWPIERALETPIRIR